MIELKVKGKISVSIIRLVLHWITKHTLIMCRFSLIFLIALGGCVIQEKYPVSYRQFSKLSELDSSKSSIVGVYTRPLVDTYYKTDKEDVVIMILFDNSIVYISGASLDDLSQENIPCYKIPEKAREVLYFWGQYFIRNDSIIIERVNSTRSVFERFGKVEYLGKIDENGSISLIKRKTSRIETQLNESYAKFPCEVLPVSTNIFSRGLTIKDSDE